MCLFGQCRNRAGYGACHSCRPRCETGVQLFCVPCGCAATDVGVGEVHHGAAPVRVPQSIETNGEMRPFFGPPLQGFSGYALVRGADGSQFALIDNGFGGKANSTDALLGFTRLLPDFETGSIEVAERVWLHDPDMRVSF